MSQEVICPKCGSPEVTEKTLLIYRRSGKRVWGKRPFLMVLASVSLLFLILTSVAGLVNSLDQWYLIFVGFAYFGTFPIYMLVDYLISDKAKQNQYHCAKCGNKWSERIDDGENILACVECGSINTLTRKSVHDPKTDKKLSGFLYVGLGGLLALLGLGMVILTFFNWGFMTCQSLAYGLLGLSGGIPMVMKYLSGKKLLRNKCLDCGHEWEVSREKGTSLSQ